MVDNELKNWFSQQLASGISQADIAKLVLDSYGAATIAKEEEETRTKVYIAEIKECLIADIENNSVEPADVGYMAALVFVREYPMATKETLEEVAESAIKDVYGDI